MRQDLHLLTCLDRCFDAAVVFLKKFSLLFRLVLAILCFALLSLRKTKVLKLRTSSFHMKVLTFFLLHNRRRFELLKVSWFWNVFLVFSILPKKEEKIRLNCSYLRSNYFQSFFRRIQNTKQTFQNQLTFSVERKMSTSFW